MEPIKINLTTPVKRFKSFNIVRMEEHENELLIILADKECFDVNVGQKLTFIRHIPEENGNGFTLGQSVRVLRKGEKHADGGHIIYTTLLPKREVALKNGKTDITLFSGVTYDDKLDRYYILETKEDHNIFQQDLHQCNGVSPQEVYVKNYYGETLGTFIGDDVFIPLKRSDRIAISGDCLTEIGIDKTCGKDFEKVTTYHYDFLPEKISKNKICLRGFSSYIAEQMVYLETKFNPFYYYTIEVDAFGNDVKVCHFYEDVWWSEYSNLNETDKKRQYTTNGFNHTELTCVTYFWNVNLGLSNMADETTLGEYDSLNHNVISNIENSIIPEVIDMERVKYSPMTIDSKKESIRYFKWTNESGRDVYVDKYLKDDGSYPVYNFLKNKMTLTEKAFHFDAETDTLLDDDNVYYRTQEIYDNSLSIATSITFSLHFRARKKAYGSGNTKLTEENVYKDGWFIDPDNENNIWWNDFNGQNGFPYTSSAFSESLFSNFIQEKGLKSDLIGYLNFTDKDVYYRKKKVAQSFIRLTFYNSTDPITQKLLFYSTIFLDSGALYGKYIRQKEYMDKNKHLTTVAITKGNEYNSVVFCDDNSVSARVDSQIIVTNEYNRQKSSEGFNLYLFAEDKGYNITEKGQKTIYMKVEFNHAGNGKTIPMIMWPKNENGDYVALTRENFLSSLYIPVQIAYLNKRYVYYIEDAYTNSNGNIDLVLFEPKLSNIEEIPIINSCSARAVGAWEE